MEALLLGHIKNVVACHCVTCCLRLIKYCYVAQRTRSYIYQAVSSCDGSDEAAHEMAMVQVVGRGEWVGTQQLMHTVSDAHSI